MSSAHIRLTYDGSALEMHTMDVKMLAPSLLAFGDLCEEVTKIVFGESVSTKVEVKASFQTGSFGINLSVTSHLLQQLKTLFSGKDVSAIINGEELLKIIIGGSIVGVSSIKGLIAVIRWLKNRKIKNIEILANGNRRIIVDDGESLDAEENIINLLRSREVRTNLQRVIEPIETEGINTLSFGDDEKIAIILKKEEAQWFHVPLSEDIPLSNELRIMSFSIVSLSFKEENKWRLSDGNNTMYVTISDLEFLNKVNLNMIRFAKGDILIASTRIAQWQTADGGLKTEYIIEHVIEHRLGTVQIPLPLDQ
jgi:hypothetical protein